jgi:ABC-type transport system involved in cytochrome bd biosynthesis fused ATPase/permease subunit
MPKLKGYGSAAAVAATCCWALFLTTGENISNVDAFVAPKTRQHHYQCNLPFSVTITPTMTTTSLFLLSQDLHQKMKYLDLERTGEDVDHADEAAVSASLYMNPADSKLAPHVQVSWEPDAAKIIKQLAKISNPSRPLMVGIVGIPGSGKSTSCEILAAYLEDEVEAMVMPM